MFRMVEQLLAPRGVLSSVLNMLGLFPYCGASDGVRTMKLAVSRFRLLLSAMMVIPVLTWTAFRGETETVREDGLERS